MVAVIGEPGHLLREGQPLLERVRSGDHPHVVDEDLREDAVVATGPSDGDRLLGERDGALALLGERQREGEHRRDPRPHGGLRVPEPVQCLLEEGAQLGIVDAADVEVRVDLELGGGDGEAVGIALAPGDGDRLLDHLAVEVAAGPLQRAPA